MTNCYPTKSLHANLTIGPEPFDDPFNIEGPFTRNIGARSLLTFRMKLRQPLKITSLSKETVNFRPTDAPFS
ncbi:hypothetical protein M378DRAFT_170276 [Amanita muscaria Koide BX008]|uniref:Uncharacterized protein n=1 Tax=Amanita muscaria (strain Koide BX008) TaxID=946122 RepID=A0A0C2S7H0_AMAMK|nr:hypothetical protein M378DRAFT_170276 [Amanita muscaria Koide BX008]